MNKAAGPPDFLADVVEHPTKCPQCGARIQLNHKTCINCLLREGLETKGEGSRETFESVLVEDDVTDTHWRLGHYEILDEIGRGGMGVIYRARQQHSRRIVAVKRMLSHQVNSHETLVRFRREAEAVASLDHPNILPIHEISESEEGLPYFSMKYAMGGSLRAAAPALRNKRRECVRLMAKIARAVAYAHGKGILHRDLQPGNILLDENGEPMVSDFGLAKWLDQGSDLTRTLETLGTPGYIAPEQTECPADKLTCAADVYSLGAILFYLLTGRPPFVGTNVLHVIHQAAATPAPRLRLLAPSLDRDVETIVARCLESDPKARYESAGALAEDLEHWLRHEPIRARRSGVFTRGRKWVRRNPTSTVLVVLLAALGVVIGVMFWEKELLRPLAPVPTGGVAVLPLENLGADPENASFTDGMQDEILNDLTKIADLKVISRTSVMQYKAGVKRDLRQIANEVGVTHVVEGSVQRSPNRVRITAQLIDAKTGRRLWQQHYDRPLDDVFAIQSGIAQTVAVQLQARLSPKQKAAIEGRPTSDLAAYDLYLKAKELMYNARFNPARREKALFQAVQLLEQAVARDPTFLLAHCQLAYANDAIYFGQYDHTETRLALAETSIEAAVRLQPDSGETHLARAIHFFFGYLNYDRAREELTKAQRELPNSAEVFRVFGGMNRWEGRWEEARQNLERAVELDPRNTRTITDLGWVYIAIRKYDEADGLAIRLQALEPRSPILRTSRAWIGLEARADMASLRAVLNTIESESAQSANEVSDLSFRLALFERDATKASRALANMPREGQIDMNGAPFPHAWYEGLLAKLRQDAAAAHSAFTAARSETEKLAHAQPANEIPLSVLALIDAQLGDKEKAIREGRTACDMLPPTKNALDGVWLRMNLARIYAITGEKNLALEQLDVLSKLASSWFGISYGELRLNPDWDSLRGDPRFEKLVEESKKPVALESPPPVPAGIAVLPFENLSADPDNAFFADGVENEIRNNLAKIEGLKVISRTSVMQYKSGAKRNLREIASELGVAHAVEGSVQRAGNRVRVSAQLIDAKDDAHLWAENYDRPLDDVFFVQSEIARAIANKLSVKLSPNQSSVLAAAPTHDSEAYDLFLKGEYEERQAESAYTGEIYDRVASLYRQALARDPSFALAYARLAYSRLNRHWYINRATPAQLEEIRSDIERALAIAPDLPDAHLALGVFHYWGRHDFDPALREFARAIELQPSNAVSREFRAAIYRRRGEWRRALAEFERAMELDPRDVWKSDAIGNTYLLVRRWRDAEHWLKHALALDPHHLGAAYRLHLTYLASTGDIQRAKQAWEGIPVQKATTTVGAYEIVIPQLIDDRVYFDVLERNFPAALKQWDVAPANTAEARLVQLKARVGIQVLAGQNAAAKPECEEARGLLEAELAKRQPGDHTSWSEIAWIYVCLGRNADALRIAREAAESMPIEKDAVLGVAFLVGLAQIEAHTGQSEEAVKHLRQLLTIPAGEYVSVARLKIDPVWDPIRNDPGFQKLLSEPEPETVYR
jgi:TolB-like protein/Tfp pilus assembly protein PilF/tRNA A-37 threonylcarbamoyl transferase component Bud32